MAIGWNLEALTNKKRLKKEPWRPGAAQKKNPVGGWYELKKGFRGRFGVYIPPLMKALGLAEVTHDAKGNKMRAK